MTAGLFIVTGLSGSGKTMALKSLEDLGCEVIDNLPLSLCAQVVHEKGRRQVPLALGLDVRARDFDVAVVLDALAKLRLALDTCHHTGPQAVFPQTCPGSTPAPEDSPNTLMCPGIQVLFFEADTGALCLRYRESRRRHPLGQALDLDTLIEQERALLAPLRAQSTHVINTTRLSPPELKSYLRNLVTKPFAPHGPYGPASAQGLSPPQGGTDHTPFVHHGAPTVYLMSFAFRLGVPGAADTVFDMRFLPNPYYTPSMKLLTGKSQQVADFFKDEPLYSHFLTHCQALVLQLLGDPRASFVIAFGCSGGKHRSVFTAEHMAAILRDQGFQCTVFHRDLH